MEYGENKICLKRQKNLFIILQDGWWGLDLHRKLNQQNQYFQIAILISVICLSPSFWWLSTKSVLKDHLGQHVFGDFECFLFLVCASTRKKDFARAQFVARFVASTVFLHHQEDRTPGCPAVVDRPNPKFRLLEDNVDKTASNLFFSDLEAI